MTNRAAVFEVLDNLDDCKISGWRLTDMVYELVSRRPYPASILQAARDWACISGGLFECIDNAKSIYHVAPGVKISGAIID